MATGTMGIHHLAVAASNFDTSKAWYDRLFTHLGLAPVVNAKGYPHKESDGRVCIYAGNNIMFSLWEAEKAARGNKFFVYNVGLHHLAFAAPSRAAVDELHKALAGDKVKVLDAPKEYQYMPGYYAVFFQDPDGMKLEYVFTPPAK